MRLLRGLVYDRSRLGPAEANEDAGSRVMSRAVTRDVLVMCVTNAPVTDLVHSTTGCMVQLDPKPDCKQRAVLLAVLCSVC